MEEPGGGSPTPDWQEGTGRWSTNLPDLSYSHHAETGYPFTYRSGKLSKSETFATYIHAVFYIRK